MNEIQKAAGLVRFKVSKHGILYTKINPENSIDTSKLLSLNLNSLGNKEIIIKQVYPKIEDKLCSLNNYPNCPYLP